MLKRICATCGQEFVITDAEIASCAKRNVNLPVNCESCRKLSRLSRKKPAAAGDKSYANFGTELYQPKTEEKKRVFSKTPTGRLVLVLLILCGILLVGFYRVYRSVDPGLSRPGSPDYHSELVHKTYAVPYVSEEKLKQDFERYKAEVGALSPDDFLFSANAVIANPEAFRHNSYDQTGTAYYLRRNGEIGEAVVVDEQEHCITSYRICTFEEFSLL